MAALPKVLVYGAGQLFQDFVGLISAHFEIVSIVETHPKQTAIGEYSIISVDDIHTVEWSMVIVASNFLSAISDELLKRNVDHESIKALHEIPEIVVAANAYVTAASRAMQPISSANSSATKIRFVINSLGAGGAEKSLLSLIAQLSQTSHSVTVLSLFDNNHYRDQFPDYIDLVCLSDFATNQNVVRLALRMADSKLINQWFGEQSYDLDIAYLEGWATKVVAYSQAHRTIAWCHTNLQTNHWTQNYCFADCYAEQDCYAAFNDIVFVSQDAKDGFNQLFNNSVKQQVIANYIGVDAASQRHQSNSAIPHFFSVGRLAKVKGYDRLLNACKALHDHDLAFQLTLFGDGPEREALQQQAIKLGIDTKVVFAGFVEDPFVQARDCDCFISASYTEGHPLAVAEALLTGFPVIATNCGGNSEILDAGESGLLIDNSEAGLFSGLSQFCSDKALSNKLTEASRHAQIHQSNQSVLAKIFALLEVSGTEPLHEVEFSEAN
ncbi:glycosyltransferase [Alteromonas flava]|uniref:glycosyltransferase n=1 Tax=Alteromonas flava TaxID=2048003 RepID=UPI000C28F9F1|nr:glycosyltransferase [Alteromonas flava]